MKISASFFSLVLMLIASVMPMRAAVTTYYDSELKITYQYVTVEASSDRSALLNAFGSDQTAIAKIGAVVSLKIKGTINSYDIQVIRNQMTALKNLDITEATIVKSSYKFYGSYTTEDNVIGDYFFRNLKIATLKLSDTATKINDGACQNMASLTYVYIGKATKQVGSKADGTRSASGAFWQDTKLTTVKWGGNNVKRIAAGAFTYCSALTTITIPSSVTTLGSALINSIDREIDPSNNGYNGGAFAMCSSLTNIVLSSSLTSLPASTFWKCTSLSSINIPSSVTSIGENAFGNCPLTSINLPSGLKTISSGAFWKCSKLTSLTLPSSLTSISNNAFEGCNAITKIYTYTVEPVAIGDNTFTTTVKANATLYVPRVSFWSYFYSKWNTFKGIEECDVDYEFVYLNEDFVLENGYRFSGTPDILLYQKAGLIVKGNGQQKGKELMLTHNGIAEGGSYIAENGATITANKMTYKIAVNANTWYFLSFPYDVQLSTVKYGGQYVFRYYDSASRAQNGSSGNKNWKNVTETKLNKRQGYIFQGNKTDTLFLTSSNPVVDGNDISLSLTTYSGAKDADASWNFVGNPYPCYYNIKDLDYKSPITIWNVSNKSYMAYSPTDDSYKLAPLQAFFVQKPASSPTVGFLASCRTTQRGWTSSLRNGAAPRHAPALSDRKLVDITLWSGEASDRTRIVYNDEASMGYEAECDASKFFSADAMVQIYTVADGTEYAINERPFGYDDISIVYYAQQEGELTIQATRMDEAMLLTDLYTGVSVDLSQEDYTFYSEAGVFADRFVISPIQNATSIETLDCLNTVTQSVYDLQGRNRNAPQRGMNIINGKIQFVK